MMTLIFMMFNIMALVSMFSLNPMKMIYAMMIMMSFLCATMAAAMSTPWTPLILFMLFIGGILVSFMMIASIMPNEKSFKMKIFGLVLLTLVSVLLAKETSHMLAMMFMKNELSAGYNLLFLTFNVMLYFVTFIAIISQDSSPLRTTLCQYGYVFVKHRKSLAMSIIRKKDTLLSIMNGSLWDLPSPSSMSYFWNFGSTLGVCLGVQIITGLLLTFHYTSYASQSFSSIIEIMREVWSGWFIRLVHMNGASMFFLFVYLHLFRGLYFLSSTHKKVWNSGVLILLTLMAISFLGYVLPWGQMSYWGVAVITNLFSVVPIIGTKLVTWIWGGFSVSAPTLTRFYSLHFLMPFILSFLVILHLLFLHKEGSSNSLGFNSNMDKVEFHPYFSTKDLYFIMMALVLAICISFYQPYLMGDPVNNVPANAMQTPIHIQPEWYFLPSYAILRSLPSKTAGVIALALSVSIFLVLPLYTFKYSSKFSSPRIVLFWLFVFTFMFLMKMGALPAEEPYITLSKWGAMLYFSTILIINI